MNPRPLTDRELTAMEAGAPRAVAEIRRGRKVVAQIRVDLAKVLAENPELTEFDVIMDIYSALEQEPEVE